MRRCLLGAWGVVTCTAVLCAATSGGVADIAERTLRLSGSDRAALDGGEPVVRTLTSTVAHELVLGGAIRLEVPPARIVDVLRDVPRWKHGPGILQLAPFSPTPTAADVETLRLDEPDLAALRRCVGRPCDTKLAALAPEAFRAFDWRAPGAHARAEALVRDGVLRHVVDYLARGNDALLVYASRGVSVADELAGLLRGPACERTLPPALRVYLEHFPRAAPPGTSSSMYWARENFGFKPLLSIYHVVVHRPPGGDVFIATKQIFASRYFDASLDLAAVGEDAARPGTGCYVAYLVGSRTDSLRGMWGRMKRGPAARGAEEGLATLLRRIGRLAEGVETR